ncbi:hypothetical protein QTP88_000207 [Uroleucon formosanum]
MCESDNESENNSSAHISVFEQRAYIKIETIRGKTVPEIHRIIAIDETWIRDFEPELKSQSNIWKGITSPRAKKVRRQQTKVKQMMIFAYDKLGIIVTDRVPIGSSVTGDYYKTFLAKKLRPEIRKKRPGMLQNGVSILHDNARPHIGAPVVALLEKYGWERLKHPPYSPDLSPPDFDLFPKLKEPLRGIRFPNLDILNEEVSRRIRELNKDGVLCGIQALPKRWQSCIDKQGDYIEACSTVEKDDLPILMKFVNTKLFDQVLNVCRYRDMSD